jgi:hypothetical protein
MSNLTETAYQTRKIIKIGAIIVVLLIIGRIFFNALKDAWTKSHPPPPLPPTVAFGKLPKVIFPKPDPPAGGTKLSYKLETVQGGLPTLATITNVYFMPKKEPNLLALDRANEQVKKIGFTQRPEPIDDNRYRWKTDSSPSTSLEMDINTGNFQMRYEYENDQELLNSKYLPTNEQAASEAKNFLTANELIAPDLANGTAEFDYLKASYPGLITVVSLSEADFVRVNLFRATLNDLKVLSPNPKKSLISFLFSGSRELGKRIMEINYIYWPVSLDNFATYPLKPISYAWNQVQSGEAYIANLGQNEDGKITIRQIYLAYYDSESPQNYMQPIYVFEGDKNFFAYVSAVNPEWSE